MKIKIKKAFGLGFTRAFTLAEIMIALVVIGVITSILLPVAFNSVPDENVMKFKKGNATLAKVINELVSSDKYYSNGDLGVKANGDDVDSATYFCETFADVISTKSVNCSNYLTPRTYYFEMRLDVGYTLPDDARENPEYAGQTLTLELNKEEADKVCKEFTNAGSEIVTTDGITYYQTSPGHHFGWKYDDAIGNSLACGTRYYGGKDTNGNFFHGDENGLDRIYKPFCMDIDGINQGEDPFGYGIRADGKILTGKRADEWLEKSIQDKE